MVERIPPKTVLYEIITESDFDDPDHVSRMLLERPMVKMMFDKQNDLGLSVYTDDTDHDIVLICSHDELLAIETDLYDKGLLDIIQSRCLSNPKTDGKSLEI